MLNSQFVVQIPNIHTTPPFDIVAPQVLCFTNRTCSQGGVARCTARNRWAGVFGCIFWSMLPRARFMAPGSSKLGRHGYWRGTLYPMQHTDGAEGLSAIAAKEIGSSEPAGVTHDRPR